MLGTDYVCGDRLQGKLLFNNRIVRKCSLRPLAALLFSVGVETMYQLEMFRGRETRCRECGKRYLEVSPDVRFPGYMAVHVVLRWAQDMGFCSSLCLSHYEDTHSEETYRDSEGHY